MTALADRGVRLDICSLDELTPELGVAALVGGERVAVFRLARQRPPAGAWTPLGDVCRER